MSTELKALKGKIEIPRKNGSMVSDYKDTEISLNSFFGGVHRGKSLQITFLNEKGDFSHVQLDNKNTKLLLEELKQSFS